MTIEIGPELAAVLLHYGVYGTVVALVALILHVGWKVYRDEGQPQENRP